MQRTALVVGDRALTDPQLWEALLERFEETGLVADEEIGPTDAFEAIISALQRVRPSEVIISRPGGSSFRSRSKGLPARVREHTDVPVTVVGAGSGAVAV